MIESDAEYCVDTLLDLLCHERMCGRLSPEMSGLLDDHLEMCPDCRRRVKDFMDLVASAGRLPAPASVN